MFPSNDIIYHPYYFFSSKITIFNQIWQYIQNRTAFVLILTSLLFNMTIFVANITIHVLNMTVYVPNMMVFCLNITVLVPNLIVIVPNMSVVIHNSAIFVPNMTIFVPNTTLFASKDPICCQYLSLMLPNKFICLLCCCKRSTHSDQRFFLLFARVTT